MPLHLLFVMIELCQGDILMSTQFNETEKTFARDVRDFKSNLKLDKISKNTFNKMEQRQ